MDVSKPRSHRLAPRETPDRDEAMAAWYDVRTRHRQVEPEYEPESPAPMGLTTDLDRLEESIGKLHITVIELERHLTPVLVESNDKRPEVTGVGSNNEVSPASVRVLNAYALVQAISAQVGDVIRRATV